MSDLTRDEIIDILLNEMECVQRASDGECNRDCGKCDLLRDADKILQAYRIAIKALEHPEENVVKIIPHGDTISRHAVLDICREEYIGVGDYKNHAITRRIVKLPSTEKIGHWIEDIGYDSYKCSNCGDKIITGKSPYECFKFCSNCGSKMIESEE